MNKPTKELFDAPWKLNDEDHAPFLDIIDAHDWPIAQDLCTDYAKWLVRVPDLYDALLEAVWSRCYNCFKHLPLTTETILEHGCLKERDNCECIPWIELLQKIRNGE